MDNMPADALIHEIGTMIVQDEKYADRDWDGISVVGIYGEGATQISGYSYDANGVPKAGTPRNKDLHYRLRDLHKAMADSGQGDWKTVLIQIRRADMNVKMDFEYENPLRWKVTPKNLKTMPAQLRP